MPVKGSRKAEAVTRHPLYGRWCLMKQRCYNPNDVNYKHYGGRGIFLDQRWHTFDNFAADMGLPPSGFPWQWTIERKDNDGPYSKENCIWATPQQQQNNKSNNVSLTHNGKTQNVSQWARELGIPEQRLRTRVCKLGMTIEEALAYKKPTPTGKRKPA